MKNTLFFLVAFLTVGATPVWAQMSCQSTYVDGIRVSVRDDSSWGYQIFQRDLDLIQQTFRKLQSIPKEDRVKTLLKDDARKAFFEIEVLAKIYLRARGEKFERLNENIKEIEDAFGEADLAKDMKELADALGQEKLVEYFSDNQKHAEKKLRKILEDQDLLTNPDKGIAKMREKLGMLKDWPSPTADRVFLVNDFVTQARKLHADVLDRKFDKKDIEEGLHELRRRIRWISIEFLALEGVVVMNPRVPVSEGVERWYQELLNENPDLMNNKYMKVGPVTVMNPIQIPGKEIAILSDLVRSIGTSKDQAEAQIEIAKALEELGVGKKERKKIMEELREHLQVSEIDHRALANEYQNKLSETELLIDLANGLIKTDQ